jgi:hypothetical protein
MGLALVAVFAIAAIGSAAASAAGPIYFTCGKAAKDPITKAYLGHYAGKECKTSEKTETGGKYTLVPGIGKGKAAKTKGGIAILHSVNPEAKADIPVECQKFKGSFEVVAPNGVKNAKTTFSKCKALGAPCENIKKETIETKVLAGSLGWINKAEGTVGTDLVSEASPGGPVAEFTCAALGEIRTTGSVIGQNTADVGVTTGTADLVFAPGPYLGELEAEGGLKWTPIVNVPKLEGGPVDILKTEVKGAITGHPTEFYPPGGIPSGQEGLVEGKGEKIGIYEEGSV